MRIILVFAHDRGVFLKWCEKNGISPHNRRVFFVENDHAIRGVSDPLILKLEGWENHRVWDTPYFEDMLRARGRSGPPIELTSKQAVNLLQFLAKYPNTRFIGERLESFASQPKNV